MTARVQDAGLAFITNLLLSSTAKYVQWGSGTGAAKTANAVTTTSTTEARTAGTQSQQTSSVTNDQYRVVGLVTSLGTRAITEVGVHDAAGTGGPATGGNMDIYGDFAVINVVTGDTITFTINTTFS